MVTAKQASIGFVALLLVMLLIVVAAFYWQHVTGASLSHLLAGIPHAFPIDGGQGC